MRSLEPEHLLHHGVERDRLLGAVRDAHPRELDLAAQDRERRPQLVARVVEEAALVRDRGFDARQHLVEPLGELRDLRPARRPGP